MVNDSRSRNIIAKTLGTFWILDGLLQCQLKMFAPDFVANVLAPNLANQPSIVHWFVALGISLWNANPILANTIAALLQIAIGILLFFPASTEKPNAAFRTGLYLSVAWGTVIWIFGEGAGGLFTGSASFYTGAPGSALIYVLLASLLLIPPEKISMASYPKIAGWIIVACSFLQPQPVILFCLTFLVGLMLTLKPNRVAGIIALVFLFVVWWLGQDFGQLSTLIVGTATDPNTAPVLALLVVPIFFTAASSTDRRYSKQL